MANQWIHKKCRGASAPLLERISWCWSEVEAPMNQTCSKGGVSLICLDSRIYTFGIQASIPLPLAHLPPNITQWAPDERETRFQPGAYGATPFYEG